MDTFVVYEQPVFVPIPHFAETRDGTMVLLDALINMLVEEFYYDSSCGAQGDVLDTDGAASVKYKVKDLLETIHGLMKN